jgi:hypothetical protein
MKNIIVHPDIIGFGKHWSYGEKYDILVKEFSLERCLDKPDRTILHYSFIISDDMLTIFMLKYFGYKGLYMNKIVHLLNTDWFNNDIRNDLESHGLKDIISWKRVVSSGRSNDLAKYYRTLEVIDEGLFAIFMLKFSHVTMIIE